MSMISTLCRKRNLPWFAIAIAIATAVSVGHTRSSAVPRDAGSAHGSGQGDHVTTNSQPTSK
jgi:hypothetical protein